MSAPDPQRNDDAAAVVALEGPTRQLVLTEADRRSVLHDWNATRAEFPDVCAHELFERQVATRPSALAVVCGEQRLTYQELNERANRVAHHLRRRGVGPDSLVAVSMHRTPLMVVGLLGVWKAGAAYVPLDPTYPADRLAFMLEDAGVHALLTDAKAKLLFPDAGGMLICMEADWSAIERESAANPITITKPSNLAYVIYTSGSTGKPKGALIVHSGLVNYLWWAIGAYGVTPGGSVPVHSSISFDLTVTSLYPALLGGGVVDLVPEDVGAQSLLASLRRSKDRSLVKITPAHLELLTQQISADEALGMTRVFVIGGENLTAESLRFWRDAAPTTRLINEYGPTETVVGCCVHEVGSDDPSSGSVPIGRPIANTELYVLDDALQPVPIGATGELYIGGAGVARGYLNRPELTRERFLADPFSGRTGARLYKTGDLARYRRDGTLEYLGRVDNQVKVRGYRIELGEIESTLAGHPQVQSCAVVVREDSPGNKQLVAYIVAHKNQSCAAEEARQFLRSRLPDYMVPAHYVCLESFPLTQNGKVDRRALPAPSYADARVTQDYVAPTTAKEIAVAAIWAELLGLDRIGIHDDVFELGATSLMVLGAVSRIRSSIGADIDMQIVFEQPTIAQMASALDGDAARSQVESASAAAPTVPNVAPGPRSGVEPPASAEIVTAEPHVIPIRFGPPGQELLGLYQRPSADSDRRESCVLCNPFGQEAMRSHRVYRIIADRLSRAGFHVLRFDYFGTGDSPGDDSDGNLDRWADDVLRADDELSRRSGCTRMRWFGLRVGATVAILASAKSHRRLKRLVLWDPIVDGARYLADLATSHVSARSSPFELRWEADSRLRALVSDEARSEALGYELTATLKGQLGALSPETLPAVNSECVELLSSRNLPPDASSWIGLGTSGVDVRRRGVESEIDWAVNEMLSDSIVSPADFRTLVAAVTDA